MYMSSLMNVFRSLTADEAFLTRVDTSVTAIMKDGKIDQYDIPDLVFLITDVIATNTSNFNLTPDSLEALLVLLYNFIVNKYNLIPTDGNREGFKRLFESSIRLALLQPIVDKAVKNCFSFCRR
jgi:hypothetical protein